MFYFSLSFTLILSLALEHNSVSGQYTAEQIWRSTTAANADELLGLGGRYGCIAKKFISKGGVLENDHFPPTSAYEHARDPRIKALSKDKLAVVTMTKAYHDQFYTTKNNRDSQAIMRRYFQDGQYFQAIDTNIGWYLANPPRGTPLANVPLSADTGRPDLAGVDMRTAIRLLSRQAGYINWLHEGLIAGLEVHVVNGLITQAQKDLLISKHTLTDIGFRRGESPRRDAARKIIFDDVEAYRRLRQGTNPSNTLNKCL